MSLFQVALTIFLVANPIGNTPAFVSLVKNFDFERQKKILFREAIFSFIIALFFLFLGQPFLNVIQIQDYTVSLSGGILLFIIALRMIFPPHEGDGKSSKPQEPFMVPIAVPLISGGGVFATIMILSHQIESVPKMLMSISGAYFFITLIVVSSVYLQKILGTRGLAALEQLMGMVLTLISMNIIVQGAHMFIKAYSS